MLWPGIGVPTMILKKRSKKLLTGKIVKIQILPKSPKVINHYGIELFKEAPPKNIVIDHKGLMGGE